MKRLAMLVWSFLPRKVSLTVVNGIRYRVSVIWLGKSYTFDVKKNLMDS